MSGGRLRVLVTGGAGYIGSVVVAELLREGHQVIVYDNLSRGHAAAVASQATLVIGDVGDRDRLHHLFRENRIDAVLHFAALIEVGESMNAPELFFRNNTASTLCLLEVMLANKVKAFVFSSTAAVYGEPENTPVREEDVLRPTNAYGESKAQVEQMLAWLNRIHGLRYASLRYFNAAGATDNLGEAHRPESHLIPLVLQVASDQREKILIYGADYSTPDGTCVRDYIHVSDLAGAHLLAMSALRERDKLIFNLGNGRGFSVREVIAVAREITGHPIQCEDAPRRKGDPAVLIASSDKIQKEIKWKPQRPRLEEIIGSAWKWHQAHPNGYPEQLSEVASK